MSAPDSCQCLHVFFAQSAYFCSKIFCQMLSFGGGTLAPGGYLIYSWVGRCGPAPHTLTLFKTKIADFPTLFKTESRFLIPCLRHLTRNQKKDFAVV